MSPHPSRRTLLATCGSVVSAAVAGCASSGSGDTDTPAPSAESPPPATATETATPTRTPRQTTVTCANQELMPDVTVENDTDEQATITVRIYEVRDGDRRLLVERTYEVGAGEYTTKAEKLFESVEEDEDGRLVADYVAEASTVSGVSARGDVTPVASSPWNYTVMVTLDDDGLTVFGGAHSDPGPTANADCY